MQNIKISEAKKADGICIVLYQQKKKTMDIARREKSAVSQNHTLVAAQVRMIQPQTKTKKDLLYPST